MMMVKVTFIAFQKRASREQHVGVVLEADPLRRGRHGQLHAEQAEPISTMKGTMVMTNSTMTAGATKAQRRPAETRALRRSLAWSARFRAIGRLDRLYRQLRHAALLARRHGIVEQGRGARVPSPDGVCRSFPRRTTVT